MSSQTLNLDDRLSFIVIPGKAQRRPGIQLLLLSYPRIPACAGMTT
jgi:hypothetical protein